MKKKIGVFLLIGSFIFSVKAQKNIDSLELVYNSMEDDSLKVLAGMELCIYYRSVDEDKHLKYIAEGEKLAKEQGMVTYSLQYMKEYTFVLANRSKRF